MNSNDQLDKCRLRIESKKQELGDVELQMSQCENNSSMSAKYDWVLFSSAKVSVFDLFVLMSLLYVIVC